MPHNLTLKDKQILEQYARQRVADGFSINTIEKQNSNVRLFMQWLYSQELFDLCEVTSKVLDNYKVYLCHYISPKTQTYLNPTTRRKRVTDVLTFFRELTHMGEIQSNPLQNSRSPKAPKPIVTAFISEEEIEWLFIQTQDFGLYGLRDRAILECYYGIAARRMELSDLMLRDLNLEGDTCSVLVEKGKGGKGRYIPLYPRTAYWLKLYLTLVRPRLANLGTGQQVFLDNRGKKFNGPQLSRLVRKYLLMAGIDVSAACNTLRHSAATHLMEHGANIREIQEYLGHADISTTQVYLTVTQLQLRQMLERCHPAALSHIPKGQDLSKYLVSR